MGFLVAICNSHLMTGKVGRLIIHLHKLIQRLLYGCEDVVTISAVVI